MLTHRRCVVCDVCPSELPVHIIFPILLIQQADLVAGGIREIQTKDCQYITVALIRHRNSLIFLCLPQLHIAIHNTRIADTIGTHPFVLCREVVLFRKLF